MYRVAHRPRSALNEGQAQIFGIGLPASRYTLAQLDPGYGPESLDRRFRHCPVLQKPVVREALAEEIEKLSRLPRPTTTAA